MKTLLCISSLLLIIAAPLHAQKPVVQELPELQEWYSWSGAKAGHVSYLPNFSKNGGMNAITQLRSGDPTWFNRFAYDTVNQFSWKEGGSFFVVPVDFNKDSVTDYMDTYGHIYTGLKAGEMPNPEPVHTVSRGGFLWAKVGDFNGDGYDDIFTPNTSYDFEIIFGGSDLTKIHRTISKFPLSTSPICAYVNELGQGRFISYRKDDLAEGFYLYGLTFEGTPNDSIVINMKLLSSIREEKTNKNQQIFISSAYMLYNDVERKNHFFNIVEYPDGGVGKVRTRSYLIKSDSFNFIRYNAPGTNQDCAIQGSLDGDSIPDVVMGGTGTQNGEEKIYYYLYSGNPIFNDKPRAFFKYPGCNSNDNLCYIGDVTGDGVGDIAYTCSSNGMLYIFKGVDWRKVGIDEITEPKLTLSQTEPNPINASGLFVLPMNLERGGHYTVSLYNLSGKFIAELYSGELPSGSVRLPLNITTYQLPSGIYTLRLSDGKQTRERAFSFIR